MKTLAFSAALAALLAGCATPTTLTIAPDFLVEAALETPQVGSIGDSADDPAIYVSDAGTGWIAGTDKQAGLHIYHLDGTAREYFEVGPVNNVDLRDMGDEVVLVASNDEDRQVMVMRYDAASDSFGAPVNVAVEESPYGICLGNLGGELHVGVTTKAGIYYQYALDGDALDRVREFSTNSKTEGCAFDDRTGELFIAEEEGGFYRYGAKASDGDAVRQVLARPGDFGTTNDFEGVAVYPQGPDGGYVVLSSQGNDSYALFALPGGEFAGRFGTRDGTVDAVTHTDGLDVTAKPTARFPQGFLVVQDNGDDGMDEPDLERQNFKIIDWRDVEAGLEG